MKPLSTLLFLPFVAITCFASSFRDLAYYQNAVLQMDQPIRISAGHSVPGRFITVTMDGDSAVGRVDVNEKFTVELPARSSGGPYTIEFSDGNEVTTVDDVYIGEVWMCIGQSNMVFSMTRLHHPETWAPAVDDNDPLIRMRRSEGWLKATSLDTIRNQFAATPYYFARALRRELNVPIGLVVAGEGGTSLWEWTPEELHTTPGLNDFYQIMLERNALADRDIFNYEPADGFAFERYPFFHMTFGELSGFENWVPTYPSRGIVFWQGENDVGSGANYERIFKGMLDRWRARADRNWPFVFIQLPTYVTGPGSRNDLNGIVGLRDAQRRFAISEPDTHMMVSYDIYGVDKNIHPSNKVGYGERLANTVLGMVYEQPVAWRSPEFTHAAFAGGEATLTFAEVGSGLRLRGGSGSTLNGFILAGVDGVFHPAQATILGTDTVVVSSSEVADPVAVRYAWAQSPSANLVGETDELPVSPFRSDDWTLYPLNDGTGPVIEAFAAGTNPVAGTSTALTVSVEAYDEDRMESYWYQAGYPEGSPASIGTGFSTTATFAKAGTYRIGFAVSDKETGSISSREVDIVVEQTLSGLQVARGDDLADSYSVRASSSKDFTARATDQFGDIISNPAETFQWAASGGTLNTDAGHTVRFTANSTTGTGYFIRVNGETSQLQDEAALSILEVLDLPSVTSASVAADLKGIDVTWVPSASADIDRHLIQRRLIGGQWTTLDTLDDASETQVYQDRRDGLEADSTYEYRIVAEEDLTADELQSNVVTVVTGTDFIVEKVAALLVQRTFREDSQFLRLLLPTIGYVYEQYTGGIASNLEELRKADIVIHLSGTLGDLSSLRTMDLPFMYVPGKRNDRNPMIDAGLGVSAGGGKSGDVTRDGLITNDCHPILGGKSGQIAFHQTCCGNLSWCEPAGDGLTLVSLPDQPDQALVAIYDTGAVMANGTIAPARRAHFGFNGTNFATHLTPDGTDIFSNLIRWLTGEIDNCLSDDAFTRWLQQNSITDPTEDSDANGVIDAFDFLFANDLAADVRTGFEHGSLVMDTPVNDDPRYLAMELRLRKDIGNLIYELESSEELKVWRSEARHQVSTVSETPDYSILEVRVPFAGDTKKFMRFSFEEGD